MGVSAARLQEAERLGRMIGRVVSGKDEPPRWCSSCFARMEKDGNVHRCRCGRVRFS